MNKQVEVNLNWYSLGKETLRANEKSGRPVIVVNSVNPDPRSLKNERTNTTINTYKSLAALKSNETALTIRTLPGYLSLLDTLGLIPVNSEIIEVDPHYIKDQGKFNSPYSDVLEQFKKIGRFSSDYKGILIPAFPSSEVDKQAEAVGLESVGFPDGFLNNNKRILREEDSEKFGFSMLPGLILREENDLNSAVNMFANLTKGGWLKYEFGVGGSAIMHIPKITTSSLENGISEMRSAVLEMSRKRKEPSEVFWPRSEIAPKDFGLILESDVRNHGELLINGNTQIFTYKWQEVKIVKHVQQLTTDSGAYKGNVTYFPDNVTRESIEDETKRAVLGNLRRGYYGVQGVDWFLVSVAGEIKIFITEINARWNGCTYPTIIADKLAADNWISITLRAVNPKNERNVNMHKIDDYIRFVGEKFAFGNVNDGLIVPIRFKSYISKEHSIFMPDMDVVIMGSSAEHCNDILRELDARGARYA